MEQIYHILIKKECNHKCPLCCNRLYDLDKLPTITGEQLRTADVVCLTGGEPFMLREDSLINLCRNIRIQYPNIKKLYIYTSGYAFLKWSIFNWGNLIYYIDGLNVAPKGKNDWSNFRVLLLSEYWRRNMGINRLSNRLYVLEDQVENYNKYIGDIKFLIPFEVIGRKWDKEFKTPDNEHFVRLPILY